MVENLSKYFTFIFIKEGRRIKQIFYIWLQRKEQRNQTYFISRFKEKTENLNRFLMFVFKEEDTHGNREEHLWRECGAERNECGYNHTIIL